MDYNIILPSKPRIVSEDIFKGVYEIDGLYAGYGHTLGNTLRRIILSSIPGAAITSVKIDGVSHEFSTMDGVKEDVIAILLNLKRVRFKLNTDAPQKAVISVKGVKSVEAKDITCPSQLEVLNKDCHIATLTDKNSKLEIELNIEKGLGYVAREALHKDQVEAGVIILDAIFTPIRRVNYEVENMRVGERTDYNRLRISIETDGIISPREALEKSIDIMLNHLKSIRGFKEEEFDLSDELEKVGKDEEKEEESAGNNTAENLEILKTRIEDIGLSARTTNSLSEAGIRTVGGLVRKKEEDLEGVEGIGAKAIQEIKKALSNHGLSLKQ